MIFFARWLSSSNSILKDEDVHLTGLFLGSYMNSYRMVITRDNKIQKILQNISPSAVAEILINIISEGHSSHNVKIPKSIYSALKRCRGDPLFHDFKK